MIVRCSNTIVVQFSNNYRYFFSRHVISLKSGFSTEVKISLFCNQILRAWYNKTRRKMKDLYSLLLEAERLGFVQRGTHEHLVNGKVWDPDYLVKCKSVLSSQNISL